MLPTHLPAVEQPDPHQRPFQVGPIDSDGGGIYIQGGVIHRIPPYGPVTQIMQQIDAYTDAASIHDSGIRSLAQVTALAGIIRHASEALRALDPIRTPAPALTRSSTQARDANNAPAKSKRRKRAG